MAVDQDHSRLGAFWTTLTRFDKSKLTPVFGLRNSLGVFIPLAIGVALGQPLPAVAVATGALNVSFSDGDDPYRERAKRMLLWSFLGGFALFLGSSTGSNGFAALACVTAWSFLAGMLLSLGVRAGDLGLNTLTILVVYGARPLPPETAAGAGLLAVAGGLIQAAFSLFLWPVRRFVPERRTLANMYSDLAQTARSKSSGAENGPQNSELESALGSEHTVEAERLRLLYDQSERIRLSLFMLSRLRGDPDEPGQSHLSRAWAVSAELLSVITERLLPGKNTLSISEPMGRLNDLMAEIDKRDNESQHRTPAMIDLRSEIDALAGRLRAAVLLAQNSTPEGLEAFARLQSSRPLSLRITDWLGTLKANLNVDSAVFRHAVRLAVWVAIGDAIGRSIDWRRSYWIPMTVAVVLKPDFTTTFSRGVLRLGGTFTGLVFATVLFHFFHAGFGWEVLLIGMFTFFLRSYGPANYGVFSCCIAALVVLLIALTGVTPKEVIVARGLNTAAGGIIALIAYAVWPTWERTQVPEAFAQLMDACRSYFHAVSALCEGNDTVRAELDEGRLAWRRARTNAAASVDRMSAEPRTSPGQLSRLSAILASSHQVIHAMMALEAGFTRTLLDCGPPAFRTFAHDVEFTLYYLAAALRGSAAASRTLPKLRDDHNALVKQGDTAESMHFLYAETDRLTNSLNTLREQVQRWLQVD